MMTIKSRPKCPALLLSMALCAGLATIAACESKSANGNSANSSGSADTGSADKPSDLPPDLFAAEAPSEAKGVIETKKSADVGDTVVVRGRIGGSERPFVDNRAMFTLADLAMVTCDKIEGDGCKTPWDYCCEPATEVAAKSLTVQVLGPDGKVARTSLQGLGNLAPMREVIVEGKVAKKRSDKLLIVNAEKMYVRR